MNHKKTTFSRILNFTLIIVSCSLLCKITINIKRLYLLFIYQQWVHNPGIIDLNIFNNNFFYIMKWCVVPEGTETNFLVY